MSFSLNIKRLTGKARSVKKLYILILQQCCPTRERAEVKSKTEKEKETDAEKETYKVTLKNLFAKNRLR